ncbi:hypothetical protein AAFF_G00335470 [Aldrovandia affinis]|uniref:C4a anaphylatoxin n=1 Tax=Aldrovandia affinis TaxID=143900 RepID=A0AAD7WQK0_9TELE|nr:hypothetical protein AAFF_G00335470 [Aldrovandia affinis]
MELALIFVMSTLIAASAQTTGYLITAPSIVHVGVDETVTVQLHEATKPVTVTLYFRHYTIVLSEKKSVALSEDNNYQAVVKLKVKPDAYKDVESQLQTAQPAIYLVAESGDFSHKAFCLVSTRKGYIFIQTDKPIYNPGETANYRVFTLDNYMRPTDEIITLKIFNSKGFMVFRGDVKSGHILQKNTAIPDVEPAGHWKIVASFTHLPMSNTSVEFEVREYVLPSFEVKIEPAKQYYTLREESFNFNVSARYTYGKGVNGIVYVRFGIIDDQGNKTFLPGLEKQTAIQDGNAEISLLTHDLRGKAENLTIDLEGHRLYIAVTALETASGELEEAESSTVKIVTTPYVIDLSKTKKYFTPEGMFSILATITFPDGTPAPGLHMKSIVTVVGGAEEILFQEGLGNKDGEVVLTFKVPRLAKSLETKVFVEGEDGDSFISEARMTLTATHSDSKSYLSVEVPHLTLGKGQEMRLTFRDITPPGSQRPTHIYYMIISKGRVVRMNRVERTEVTSVSLPFSYDLVPAFRVVAYYFTSNQGKTEFVADSVWVDVQDVCEGQVKIQPFEREPKPGTKVDVMVHTDQAEKVALAAVDTAVYILNKQNKLTAQKMFDYMNSYDLACSAGGGKNHWSVLLDTGLTYMSSFAESPLPKDFSCHGVNRHRRAAANHFQEFSTIVNRYSQPAKRRCCHDGAKLNTQLSCEQRLTRTRHQSPACQEAFLKCCQDATSLRKKIRRSGRRQSLARTFGDGEEDMIDNAIIYLRSYFPQTWMWVTKPVDASGILRHAVSLPDSITTWEIQAIGISQRNGFCIAEPQQLKVFQDFFVSLKLPYSVKRNEQLELKAIVYNYRTEPLQVTVKMASVAELCSAGGDKNSQVVAVPGNSAIPVYFMVVPLAIGTIPIQISAYASRDVADQIKKDLRVVGEGELVSLQEEHNIETRGAIKDLELNIPEPPDAIPGLESDAYISLKGGVMGESVENCLNLEGVDRLIVLPTGCAEQTMLKMSPAIHAMKYLDASNQWVNLNAERRDEATAMIQGGYNRVLTYMKDDGSYGAFQKTPSSVWLTAFIAKELTRCRSIIPVEDSYIRRSISYLVSKQQSSGAFNDPNPVYDRNMQGGVGGFEGDVSLTAFVLATMVQSLPVYLSGEGTETLVAVRNAEKYLEEKINSLRRPFALAITAYALSLASSGSSAARLARARLREIIKCDQVKDTCHWEADKDLRLTGERKAHGVPQADSISVETTAYALLAGLPVEDVPYSTRIARWLTEHRQYGGGFRSTQDTVVALEALAEFSMQNNDVRGLNLNVEICLSKGKKERVHLTKRNAMTLPVFQVKPGSKVTVNIRGEGSGTLSVVRTYRTMKGTDLYCDYYHLNVTLEGEVKYQKNMEEEPGLDDYYNYEAGGDREVEEEPLSRVEWFDLRTRRKRHAPVEPERESSLVYSVCVSMNGRNSTGMAIVDISLLSGLEPNIQDLEDQVKGTEKYIDHYDLGQNKVYLYFNQITESRDCVTFRAKQITPIGLVQPASAVIYDYYNPERRCSVFYSAPQKSAMLSKLCSGDVCACAEGRCPKIKVTFSKNMEENTRINYACFSPIVDYVYVAKVLSSTEDGVFKYYTLAVTRVLQRSKDETIQRNELRDMIQRKSCQEFEMMKDRDYLIMGKDATMTRTLDANGRFRYILTNEMWIEAIPEEKKCTSTRNRGACNLLHNFMKEYEMVQCTA